MSDLYSGDLPLTGKKHMKRTDPPTCFSFFFSENSNTEWKDTYEALTESENYERESSTLGDVLPSDRSGRRLTG